MGEEMHLKEKWEIDIEITKKGGSFVTSYPQCDNCKFKTQEEAKNCKKYSLPETKPEYVFFSAKECPRFEHKNRIDFSLFNHKTEKKLLDAIFGFCIGDMLGVPVEFTSREERKADPVKEMRAYGTYHQPFGTWSDDTSMTMCLIESLAKGYSLTDLANKFCAFYYDSYWTPNNEVFDIGNTTIEAIKKIKTGIEPAKCGGQSESDNGNGSLMRVLPLAFYLKNKEAKEKITIIEDVSSLTHAHAISKFACIFYVEYAINLLNKYDKKKSYVNTLDFINKYCLENYKSILNKFNRIMDAEVFTLEENKIKSSGYVVDSLEASLWSFLHGDNYSEAVFAAINLGGDTDTIAAIAGGLAGIYYGIETINENWIQSILRKEDILNTLLNSKIA